MPVRPAPVPSTEHEPGFTTRQIHGGAASGDALSGHGDRVGPIHLSAGFVFDDADQAADRFSGDEPGYVYTRVGNPTLDDVERRLAQLEGGRQALLTASGQAATTTAVLGLLGAGDHLVCSGDVYEGTRGLFAQNLARLGVAVDFVADATDLRQWQAAIGPRTRLLFTESLSNPRNVVADIPGLARLARSAGVPLVVDNTLATPYLVRPLELGADLVVHSASKFLSGHGTALGGFVVDGGTFDAAANPERYPHLNQADPLLAGRSWTQVHGVDAVGAHLRSAVAPRFGPTASPFNAFLIRQGLETLSLRMERHSWNADRIAAWLADRTVVTRVDHCSLAGRGALPVPLPRGAGSVFSFEVAGGAAGARAFLHALELFTHMSHLGDVRSLVMHPASTSHALRTPQERAAAGITDGVLRVSIGIEDVEDLERDLRRGVAAVERLLARQAVSA